MYLNMWSYWSKWNYACTLCMLSWITKMCTKYSLDTEMSNMQVLNVKLKMQLYHKTLHMATGYDSIGIWILEQLYYSYYCISMCSNNYIGADWACIMHREYYTFHFTVLSCCNIANITPTYHYMVWITVVFLGPVEVT